MKVVNTEIGNIVKFETMHVQYFGIIEDKCVITSKIWVRWFNHESHSFDQIECYVITPERFDYKYWSIVK